MLDNFRFETFVDVHSNIFAEYLSSVIAKLPKDNPEYRSIEERIEELYKEYPKVMEALDTEKPSDLSEQECKALIEVLELRNRLSDMQQEAIYFRGCYDSVGYLKKADHRYRCIWKRQSDVRKYQKTYRQSLEPENRGLSSIPYRKLYYL